MSAPVSCDTGCVPYTDARAPNNTSPPRARLLGAAVSVAASWQFPVADRILDLVPWAKAGEISIPMEAVEALA